MKIIHYPFSPLNPYQQLMFDGVEPYGILSSGIDGGLRGLMVEARSGDADVLHLHWIHSAATFEKPFGSFLRLCMFHAAVLLARLRGKRIVWTVHNLVNHEKRRAWLDRLNSKLVAREAHALLVHGDSVVSLVANELGIRTDKIKTIHHGNYAGIVNPQPPRKDCDGVRFLFFGMIRPYKGVDKLLEAFQKLSGPHRLHIAGKPISEPLQQEIEAHRIHDPERVSAEFDFIPDKRLEELLGWCDVVVLPYRDIFTSGSLLMALTAGRPVIAPRAGLIPEYVDDSAAFLYDPQDPEGLGTSLDEAAQYIKLPEMARLSAQRAAVFDWKSIGEKLARIYRDQA